jgi:ABC-type branched-subunit amino acid transport system substrate-binding protein
MVTDEGAAGLITPPSGAASHLILQVSGRTGVPVVTLCADGSVGRTGVPWLLRLVPSTFDEAKTLFSDLLTSNALKKARWVALIPDQRSGREIGQDLREAARAAKCGLDEVLECTTGSTNLDGLCARVQSAHPDAVLVWLPPREAGVIVAGLRNHGYAGLLAGPSRLQCSEFIARTAGAAKGFVVPSIVRTTDETTRWNGFAAAYAQHCGGQPEQLSGFVYDAVILLGELLQQERFRLPPHLIAHGFTWPGVTGNVSFDSKGNRKCILKLLPVNDGEFVAARR